MILLNEKFVCRNSQSQFHEMISSVPSLFFNFPLSDRVKRFNSCHSYSYTIANWKRIWNPLIWIISITFRKSAEGDRIITILRNWISKLFPWTFGKSSKCGKTGASRIMLSDWIEILNFSLCSHSLEVKNFFEQWFLALARVWKLKSFHFLTRIFPGKV